MNPLLQPHQKLRDRMPSLAAALWVMGLGVVALTITLCVGLIVSYRHFPAAPSWLEDGILVAAVLTFGLATAALLVGLSSAMRLLHRADGAMARLELGQREIMQALRSQQVIANTPSEQTNETQAQQRSDAALQEVLVILRELREYSLLTDSERQDRRARKSTEELEKAGAQIRYLLAEGEYTRAYEVASQIAERSGGPASELVHEVQRARQDREASDVAAATREVNDFISMSAWPQARQKAQALQEQHPDSSEARQLMVRIEREYRQLMEEQRRRTYAEVQRFVTRKRWEEALAAAHTFMERFVGSDEAEALRLQLPTLETNAEVEVRQRLEAQIMDLAVHGRYIEATALAKRVIEQYPDSPQADALRARLGRLEELATNPDAPPARIRRD